MALSVGGPIVTGYSVDDDGYRDYTVKFKVKATNAEGPYAVSTAAGLPAAGTSWSMRMANPTSYPAAAIDIDPFAVCKKRVSVKCMAEGDAHKPASATFDGVWWEVTKYYSTKPTGRCAEESADDPLSQADRITVTTVKRTEEGLRDYLDRPITNSAHQLLRGPQNEWDVSDFQVTIEQNVADPQLEMLSTMRDTVNAVEMWGFPRRTIKLDDFNGQRKFYSKQVPDEVGTGVTYDNCATYWTRRLTFSIRFRYVDGPYYGTGSPPGEFETWDRYVLDEATKVLRGEWDTESTSPTFKQWVLKDNPDKDNPRDFIRAVDFYGNPTTLILDGEGRPYDANDVSTGTFDDVPGRILIAYYGESNFFLLGIPTSIT